ncbi:hypothetical protein [Pseudomonas monteilii]|uniref:hypothetical protein n=1 Tax=Pseudomonas monteilii TaxID=76759 RepID=UPI0018A47868|nr:hypothetical protein [Pseudomonas monteilii]BBV97932.1 hypothetical protein STW0522PSE72_32830 [Pseudomonas monteilii]
MTIDKAKLKALAEAMLRDEQGAELSGEEVRGFPEAVRSYEAMTAPSAVLALLAEIERLSTSRSKKERELEQELETWRHGPFCWTCGDTGDVHDITGEWRGECDCLSAQLINANRERDQLKAENAQLKNHEIELKAENEALRKDAGRYRWLRDKQTFIWLIQDWFPGEAMLTNVDADIDAAMAKEASNG